MRRVDVALVTIAIALLATSLLGCSSGLSLAGDQDADGTRTDDGRPPADADDGIFPPDAWPDADRDADGDADAAADADADADGDADGDADADVPDAPPDGAIAHLIPDEVETFFDFDTSGSPADSVTPMHRHSFPVAWSGGAYAVLLEDRSAATGEPGPIALFRFERGTAGLHEVWVDEAADVTEYNSICWTGEAFVVALPTIDVGLRVLALDAAGSVTRLRETLEPSATYVPAEHGEAPVLLCPGSGAFVLDPGRGAGGLDRLYALAPDGSYSGGFVDADIPTFARNVYFAPVPCAVGGEDAACAMDTGLAFLRRDGSVRVTDPLPGAAVCGGPAGCDAAFPGSDVILLGSVSTSWPAMDVVLARWAADGRLALPPVSLGTASAVGSELGHVRVGSSGTTVLAAIFAGFFISDSTALWLVRPDGLLMESFAPVATCLMAEGTRECSEHWYLEGGAVVWEGDAYAVLWITPSGLAYRRFAVAWW